jgi:hypothetical protein
LDDCLFIGIHAPSLTQSPYGDDGDGDDGGETSFVTILKESGAEVNGKKTGCNHFGGNLTEIAELEGSLRRIPSMLRPMH